MVMVRIAGRGTVVTAAVALAVTGTVVASAGCSAPRADGARSVVARPLTQPHALGSPATVTTAAVVATVPGLPTHRALAGRASRRSGTHARHTEDVPRPSGRADSAKTVHFVSHIDDPGDRLTLGGVDPSCPVGWVAIRSHEPAHLTGQLRSVDTGGGCVSGDPVATLNSPQSSDGPAFVFAGYVDDHQVGTLDGCGTGTFTMRLTNFKITSFDVVAHAFHMTFTWAFSDGSGTGAFRGASGSGTGAVAATGSPDLTVPLLTAPVVVPNWGTYEGTITCPHHP
jgi:hypothetical protein